MTILLSLLILLLSSADGQCLSVDGEWVTAKDVADRIPYYAEADPDQRLLRTPFPGARRLVRPASLAPFDGGSPEAATPFCVERRLRILPREAFAEALGRTLVVAGQPPIDFELVDYERSLLPSGRLEFLTQSLPPPDLDRADDPILWRGRLIYAEGRSVPVWVRVRLWMEGEVCLLAREVARGERLKIEDCKITKKRFYPFAPAPLREPGALEKTTAVRRLKANEPIYQTLLARTPDVEAGQSVELKVVNGGTQLRLQAKAASSGRRGDVVTVTNPANGKRLEGQVVGQSSVEVRLK